MTIKYETNDIPISNIINEVDGSLYWKNIEGVYLGCNAFGARLVHLKNAHEIVGKTDFDIFPKELAETLRKNDLEVMSHKKEVSFEEEIDLEGDKKIVLLSFKRPLYDKYGKIAGVIGNSVDITDRKKAEELRIKHETAEKVIAFAKLMAGSMAHELRTPLGMIASRIDLLKMTFKELEPNEEVKKVFLSEYSIIKGAIEQGMHTVKDMLLKLRSFAIGKLPEVDYRELSISADIEKFLSSFPFQKGEKKLIKVIPSEGFFYFGDTTLTSHVIGNLVKNARDAIKENAGKGDITIELKKNEKFNQLIVRDTATGIPKEFLTKIFDQFETKKSVSGGTGLGLAFCKMVMESYGGNITCNSELGKYTEFVLSFPKINHIK